MTSSLKNSDLILVTFYIIYYDYARLQAEDGIFVRVGLSVRPCVISQSGRHILILP